MRQGGNAPLTRNEAGAVAGLAFGWKSAANGYVTFVENDRLIVLPL